MKVYKIWFYPDSNLLDFKCTDFVILHKILSNYIYLSSVTEMYLLSKDKDLICLRIFKRHIPFSSKSVLSSTFRIGLLR